MATDVKDILELVSALPAAQQLEVLQTLAKSLSAPLSPLATASADFWTSRSLEALAFGQNVPVVSNLDALAMPEWPRDESADDLIAYIRAQRAADRAS